MRELFEKVEQVVGSMQHGWCSVEKACTLASSIITLRATNVLEIGVYSGKSLVPMALALQWLYQHHDGEKGLVIGIDAWDNNTAAEEMDGTNREWWDKLPMEDIYRVCESTLTRYGLMDYVQLVKSRSEDQPARQSTDGLVLDLLHIDGSHGEEASMFDLTYYGYKVREGGLLFMDDINWHNSGKDNLTYQRIPSLGYRELYKLDSGAMFQRIKSDFT